MKRRRRTTTKSWILQGSIAPWMLLYARWLVGFPAAELARPAGEGIRSSYLPSNEDRVAAATRFARRKVEREKITLLERRPDFREYFENLRSDAQFLAKELVREDIVNNVEARREGLKKALDTQVDGKVGANVDHKSVEMYTRWTRDLAFPKKEQTSQAPQRIVINLLGMPAEQKRMLLKAASGQEEDDAIDYEIVENKRITDGSEDE